MRRVARRGDRALALVQCGEDIIQVSGQIVQSSNDTFAENRGVARFGDRVSLGCGKVGRLTQRVSRKSRVNSRRVALFNSGITGPGILRGWVISASRTVFAG